MICHSSFALYRRCYWGSYLSRSRSGRHREGGAATASIRAAADKVTAIWADGPSRDGFRRRAGIQTLIGFRLRTGCGSKMASVFVSKSGTCSRRDSKTENRNRILADDPRAGMPASSRLYDVAPPSSPSHSLSARRPGHALQGRPDALEALDGLDLDHGPGQGYRSASCASRSSQFPFSREIPSPSRR